MRASFGPKLKLIRRVINEKTLVYTINGDDVTMNLFNNKIRTSL